MEHTTQEDKIMTQMTTNLQLSTSKATEVSRFSDHMNSKREQIYPYKAVQHLLPLDPPLWLPFCIDFA